ncbi:MAG: MCE family protein [Candidatus Eremiobacteraeota bacterium]|nr:MCE family protein [Candidatus Eremiobacteraeota bacterium]
MSRQAQVGLFTLIGLVALFGVFYVLSDFGTRSRGYKVGVHFQSASGLHKAAAVSLSGVTIGSIDDIILEPDYTVDVILAIKNAYEIPKNSKFFIQAPLTGEPSVLILPPKIAGVETLPHKILPLADQPSGTNPASVADLLAEGQGEIKRLDKILADVEGRTPRMLNELETAMNNATALTLTARESMTQLSASANSMIGTLNVAANRASANVIELTASLDATVKRNSRQIDDLLVQLNGASKSARQTMDSVHDLAANPRVHKDLISTVDSFALTARTFAELSNDLRQVTGNPQTQAQMRDTVAQFDATMQKVDNLLASLGGTSSVYGVDKGATPAPGGVTPLPPGYVPTSRPALPGGSPGSGAPVPAPAPAPGVPAPASSGSPRPGLNPAGVSALKDRLNKFAKDLVEIQVRVSQLAPLRPGSARTNTSPLLTADRGPMSDFNINILPRGGTSLFAGVNDVGANSTANFMLFSNKGNVRYGGGVEYSRLGVAAAVSAGKIGLETRAYDLRHPTVDIYGNLFLAPKFQLFVGERDITHQARRTILGLQFEI